MPNAWKPDQELSPLDQIRHVEAEMIREIAAAREAAGHKIIETKGKVKELLRVAQESGRNRGKIHHQEIIAKTEEEARALVAQAKRQAEDLRYQGKQRIDTAVSHAVNLVIGLERSGEDQ